MYFYFVFQQPKINDFTLRFVAVSATVTNVEDIAKWLTNDQNGPAHYLKYVLYKYTIIQLHFIKKLNANYF